VSHQGPPRVVLDGMVFLQAIFRSGGPAARLFLDFLETDRLVLILNWA
jgi:hypothetical protein